MSLPSDNQSSHTPDFVVLLLSRTHIQVCQVDQLGPPLLLSHPVEYPWTASTLEQTLSSIKTDFQATKVKVILGGDLGVIRSFMFVGDQNRLTQKAEAQIQTLLGDQFPNYGIDYQEFRLDENRGCVQTFMVKTSFLNVLGSALERSGLSIDSIESLATTLAPQVPTAAASVVLWGEDYLYVALSLNHQVLEAVTITHPSNIYKQIATLISSWESTYSLSIGEVFMSSSKLDPDQVTKHTNAEVTSKELNPFAGMVDTNKEFAVEEVFNQDLPVAPAEEDETENADEIEKDSAIIQPQAPIAPKPPIKVVNQSKETEMESFSQPQTKANTKLIAIIVTVVVVLIGMVVGGFFVYRNAMSEANTPPTTPIVEQMPIDTTATQSATTDEATSSATTPQTPEVDLSTLKVNVLNGSGTPGAAGKASDILEDAGFVSIATGNADNYSYTDTIVRVKANQTDLYQTALTALQGSYSVSQGEVLPANSQYDLVVIVGSK